jgi:NTE family protein
MSIVKATKIFVFTILTTTAAVYAQPYRNLVFEGAGIRGVAYAGAIAELEKQNILPCIERIGGTSAGAIAALAVALGYTSAEIENLIYNTRLQKFNDGRFLFVGGIARINRNFGWYRGVAFTKWIETIIAARTGNTEITFRELHEQGFPDLFITGTSLNRQQLIVFSHKHYPNMKIKDAVRISMSIPLYFEAVCIDSSGHVLKNKEKKKAFDVMVDGGFTGNFPIFIFDDVPAGQDKTARTCNPYTLGLRIDTPGQIMYDSLNQGLAPIEINNFQNYIGAFYSYVIENLNRANLTPEDWQRTVSISSGNIGARIRKLSIAEKDLLIRNGQEAMKQYLAATSH